MLTNPLLSFDLSFSYNLEGEITSVDWKNFDTFPVRMTINSLIAKNLPNLKKNWIKNLEHFTWVQSYVIS